MQLLERPERSRQQVDAHGRAGTYAQAAALDATDLLDRNRGLVEDIQHPPRVAVQEGARFGQLDPLAEAVEQWEAQGLLQLLHLIGDGRLAQLQTLGGKAEAVQVGDGLERAQLAERDRSVEIEMN